MAKVERTIKIRNPAQQIFIYYLSFQMATKFNSNFPLIPVLLFAFFMGTMSGLWAQNDTLPEDSFYVKFDKNPQYPTGDYEMYEFIQLELLLDIPTFQLDRIYQNNYRSLVKIYIDTSGKILHSELDHRSDDYYLHDEILETVNRMPDWRPGEVDGQKVHALVYFPVMITYFEKDQRYRDPQFTYTATMFRVVYTPLFPDSSIYGKPVAKNTAKWGILAAILVTIATVLFIRYNPF